MAISGKKEEHSIKLIEFRISMIKEALLIVILASSILAGYIIAYLCRDELVSGRKWFLQEPGYNRGWW